MEREDSRSNYRKGSRLHQEKTEKARRTYAETLLRKQGIYEGSPEYAEAFKAKVAELERKYLENQKKFDSKVIIFIISNVSINKFIKIKI
jgi:hypothetical protein